MVLFLWIVEVFILYIFVVIYLYWSLVEGVFFRFPYFDTRIFVGIIISIFLLALFTFFGLRGSKWYFLLDVLIILWWIFNIFFIGKYNRQIKRKKEEVITNLKRELEEKGEDFSILSRLGKSYKDIGEMDLALNYYERAYSFIKAIGGTETERKIKELEYYIGIEKKEKPLLCNRCGKRNYQSSLICESCKGMLHPSYFEYLKKHASLSIKIGIVWLVLSAVLFGFFLKIWANIIFYILVFIDFIILRRLVRI